MASDTHHPPKLAYSIREACAVSSLGRTTIYNHISAGRLESRRIGGRTIIPAEALQPQQAGMADPLHQPPTRRCPDIV